MPEAIFRQTGNQQDYTATADMAAGEIVKLADGRAGVVKTDLANGDKGAVYTLGIFDVVSASATTFSVGAGVYWDVSASLAVTAVGAEDDFYLGTAVIAKVNGDTTVRVDLNARPSTVPVFMLRSPFVTEAVILDHDDASTVHHEIVTADQNPDGLIVDWLIGIATEATAGGTEDQMIVTLFDEDDNALATLTTQDAGMATTKAVVAANCASNVATNSTPVTIPAGKAAYLAVTQKTSGSSMAGKLRVTMQVSPLI